jgi:hypothetical protein
MEIPDVMARGSSAAVSDAHPHIIGAILQAVAMDPRHTPRSMPARLLYSPRSVPAHLFWSIQKSSPAEIPHHHAQVQAQTPQPSLRIVSYAHEESVRYSPKPARCNKVLWEI